LLAVVGLAAALLGLVMVIRVSRAVSGPLTDLARQAEHLATVSLPATVQAILDADATGAVLPEVPRVRVGNIEEVAGVASALEELNKTAVELASGQAALRRNLSDAFVNLGRRNQNLVTRQLEYITEIELKEADPTSLEELFRLDHLATRMRRNAESLLILAGSGPARQWSASVPVMDVARAASAEVEDYQRLRLHHFDPALVTGVVTTDLVHILAELIENALSFSPPGAAVDVYGRFLEGAYVIVIVDTGIGMSNEDLVLANQRLEGLGADGEVPGRYLGHFVAGRLAARHGLTISLQPSHSGGLVARVKVPASFLEEAVADLSAGAEVRPAPPSGPAPTEGDPAPTRDDEAAAGLASSPPPVSDALVGLAASMAAAKSSGDGPAIAPVEAAAAADGAKDLLAGGQYEEKTYGRHYENGSSGDASNGDDEPGVLPDDDAGDFGSVWAAKMAELCEESTHPGPATDDALAEADGHEADGGPEAGYGVKPFDWAEPSRPSNGTLATYEVAVQEVPAQEVGAQEVGAQEVGAQEVVVQEAGAQEVGAGELAAARAEADSSYSPYSSHTPDGQSYADDPDAGAEGPPAGAVGVRPGHSWDPIPGNGLATLPPALVLPAATGETATGPTGTPSAQGDAPDTVLRRTPDLNVSAPLAGPLESSQRQDFGPGPNPLGHEALAEAAREAAGVPAPVAAGAPVMAVAASRASSMSHASATTSWSATTLPASAVPAVGPAAQARTTADALRKLTRRVPGAALPEEDNSLRRPTTMSTTRNPLGLSGALSQYLSVTVEGRPEKEHNAQ
ncbi:MAG TPA: ATP-binding protein, partial [Acidimicrobiales bacterium]|nr:ATP-binding protein [Acidimicrobiales bacterium]